MKVACVDNSMYEDILTVGKAYDAEPYSFNRFTVTCDHDISAIMSKKRFEVVGSNHTTTPETERKV